MRKLSVGPSFSTWTAKVEYPPPDWIAWVARREAASLA